MFIKRLAPNIYDVFVGNGWNYWTRVRRTRDGIEYITGHPMNQHAVNEVKRRICR